MIQLFCGAIVPVSSTRALTGKKHGSKPALYIGTSRIGERNLIEQNGAPPTLHARNVEDTDLSPIAHDCPLERDLPRRIEAHTRSCAPILHQWFQIDHRCHLLRIVAPAVPAPLVSQDQHLRQPPNEAIPILASIPADRYATTRHGLAIA